MSTQMSELLARIEKLEAKLENDARLIQRVAEVERQSLEDLRILTQTQLENLLREYRYHARS
jgi:hypothetical protein